MAEMLAFIAFAIFLAVAADYIEEVRSGRRDSRNRNRR